MSNKNIRNKIYFSFFLILLSVYVLVPSIFNFKAQRQLVLEGKAVNKAYLDIFPNAQINLGLDLRGGVYLELGVLSGKAIANSVDAIAENISRNFEEKDPELRAERLAGTNIVRLSAKDSQGLAKIKSYIDEYFKYDLEENAADAVAPEFYYSWKITDKKERKKAFNAMAKWLAGQKQASDIGKLGDLLVLIIPESKDHEATQGAFLTQFTDSVQVSEKKPVLAYFRLSESRAKKLKEEIIDQVQLNVNNRINRNGVTEPSITQEGSDRIGVELPGETDPDKVLQIILQAGKVEFKTVDEIKGTVVGTDQVSDSRNVTLQNATDAQVESWVNEVKAKHKIPEDYSEATIQKINRLLKGTIPDDSEIRFKLDRNAVNTKKIDAATPYLLKKKVELQGDMIRDAKVEGQQGQNGYEYVVSMPLKPNARKIFADLTTNNRDKRLAILLDDEVISAPNITNAILGGTAQITLGATDNVAQRRTQKEEADRLALILKEGAMPAQLKEEAKTVVGPSLGQATIRKGTMAVAAAGLVILIFMAIYYKRAGLIADVSLVANVLFILAILSLKGATLTLAGIAGIVLTLGMAVDANVIIFERIKEELAEGAKLAAAVGKGFKNAMSAILDANITTFCAALVLYIFGNVQVKSFANTLMIGIITTLITAIFGTRLLFDYFIKEKRIKKLSI